jgi:hypothetical protein
MYSSKLYKTCEPASEANPQGEECYYRSEIAFSKAILYPNKKHVKLFRARQYLEKRKNMQKKKITPYFDVIVLFPGGLIATILIIFQALIPLDKLSLLEYIAMILFAIALPILVLDIVTKQYIKKLGYTPFNTKGISNFDLFCVYGLILAVAGIDLIMWNLSLLVGSIFTISLVVCFYVFSHTAKKLHAISREIMMAEKNEK